MNLSGLSRRFKLEFTSTSPRNLSTIKALLQQKTERIRYLSVRCKTIDSRGYPEYLHTVVVQANGPIRYNTIKNAFNSLTADAEFVVCTGPEDKSPKEEWGTWKHANIGRPVQTVNDDASSEDILKLPLAACRKTCLKYQEVIEEMREEILQLRRENESIKSDKTQGWDLGDVAMNYYD